MQQVAEMGFIEASWIAISRSSYFGALYRHHRARGNGSNIAISIVARRLAHIAYTLLKENRLYEERPLKILRRMILITRQEKRIRPAS